LVRSLSERAAHRGGRAGRGGREPLHRGRAVTLGTADSILRVDPAVEAELTADVQAAGQQPWLRTRPGAPRARGRGPAAAHDRVSHWPGRAGRRVSGRMPSARSSASSRRRPG
jgi:hypothetical protein